MARLEQRVELRNQLSPQQILQASILQLNSQNLETRILTELEINPALDMAELEPEEEDPDALDELLDDEEGDEEEDEKEEISELDDKDEETDFDWEELMGDPDEYEIRQPVEKRDDNFEAPVPARRTAAERLMEQYKDEAPRPEQIHIAEEIIGNIDSDGYLTIETIIIADRLGISEPEVEEVLFAIQRLDPPGMGARTLRECLLAQLEVYEDDPLATEIIDKHFDDFANRRYKKIMLACDCNETELRLAMDAISSLNPRPGDSISENESDFIIPDLRMEEIKGQWVISLTDSTLPDLRVSREYEEMVSRPGAEAQLKNFLKEKLNSAKWFIEAIQQRRHTMMSVMEAIYRRQEKFFKLTGKRELEPMVLKNIAEDVKMDISTISRVTNGKFVQLPFGVYELKSFFSEGISKDDGSTVSNTVVKERLREIIEAEDQMRPAGDEELSKLLKKEGYMVARRTVTKYREQMRIPVARLRKGF